MTLYLAARTGNNEVIFASDGRSLSDTERKIVNDERPKMRCVRPNYVLATSGHGAFVKVIEDITGMAYDLHTKQNPATAALATVDISQDDAQHIANIMQRAGDDFRRYRKEVNSPIQNFHTTADLFGLHQQDLRTTRLHINSQQPYVRLDNSDTDMGFPYRTGGVNELANTLIMEMIAKGITMGGKPSTKADIKGRLIYLLQETSEYDKGVGGNLFLGELTALGYRQIPEGEMLDIYESAENVRAELSDLVTDIEQFRAQAPSLGGAMRTFGGVDTFRRMGDRRLAAYDRIHHEALNNAAVYLLEQAVMLHQQDSQRYPFEFGIAVAYSTLGRAYANMGRTPEAIRLFAAVIDLVKPNTNLVELKGLLRAYRGLAETKDISFQRLFEKLANDVVSKGLLTPVEIKAIK